MIDLNLVLLDFVMRGGIPDAQRMIANYADVPGHPGVYGMSAIFHPGFTLDQLTWAAAQPHGKLRYTTVAEIRTALAPLGDEPVLVHTPTRPHPDHATLGVARIGVKGTLPTLPLDAAQALAATFHIIDPNPFRQKKP